MGTYNDTEGDTKILRHCPRYDVGSEGGQASLI